MALKDIGETLPPGFRFYPSDEELVCHYLRKKIANEEALKGTLVEIDLHTCEPWQLPEVAKLNGSEWYFFSFRDRKYATGFRTNRATACGYWKATGKDRVILDPNTRQVVGMRKTLVFYRNRAPNGLKTGWIMHEFRLEAPHTPPKEDWVLCRVFHKSKGESNTHLFDTIATTTSTTSSPPPTLDPLPLTDIQGSAMVYGYQGSDYSFTLNPSSEIRTHDPNALYHSISLSPNQLLSDVIMVDDHHGDDYGTDQYGLLWDMAFGEINNLGHGPPHGHHHHHHDHLHEFGDHIYGVNQ